MWKKLEVTDVSIKIQFLPHREHCASIRKTNLLMLYRETILVYCDNHKARINTLRGQDVGYLPLQQVQNTLTIKPWIIKYLQNLQSFKII